MKIGIDLDEVTINFLDYFHDFYYKKTGKLFSKEDLIITEWREVWGLSKEEQGNFIDEFYNSEEFDNLSPVKNAIKSINSLIEKNEIFIITSRPLKFKEKTDKWVFNNFPDAQIKIYYAKDFFKGLGKSKSQICKEIGVKIMVEDDGEYALDCASSGIKVVLFNRPWNQGISHSNIIRVDDWIDAIKVIKKISANP